jgi:hypothetical protein
MRWSCKSKRSTSSAALRKASFPGRPVGIPGRGSLRAVGIPGRGSLRAVGIPGRGSLRPPAASRCSARRLAARSFPRRPPAYVLCRAVRRVAARSLTHPQAIGSGNGASAAPRYARQLVTGQCARRPERFTRFPRGSTYAGGRRGKERAASLRAEQRLAAGGRRLPRPGKLVVPRDGNPTGLPRPGKLVVPGDGAPSSSSGPLRGWQ